MSPWRSHPVLYELNTCIWLRELSRKEGRPVTLGTVPQVELERLASRFDAVWLMGVWQRSPAARQADRVRPGLVAAYGRVLPGWKPEDVAGSPFSIHRYVVDPEWGGDEELALLRRRLGELGVRLILDFVSNHLAPDHPWLAEHPEWLVQGMPGDLAREPHNYFASDAGGVRRIFAHGRDPLFAGWPDTVQVDLRSAGARAAMKDTLLDVARRCDGVRCDMAMLVTHDVFLRTWGGSFDVPGAELWPFAIGAVKEAFPDFLLLAEVYWDLEDLLLRQGFDFVYDKRLYDRLIQGDTGGVRAHLKADPSFQGRLVRFVENHDEERVAACLGAERSRAAATLALTLPGARLLHQGQLEGRRLKPPVQLGRWPEEPVDPVLEPFYRALLETLREPVFHEGRWQRLQAGELFAWTWTLDGDPPCRRLAVVNLSSEPRAGTLSCECPDLAWSCCELIDRLSGTECERDGDDLGGPGIAMSLPGSGAHLFEIRRPSETRRGWAAVEGIPGVLRALRLPGNEAGIYGLAWSPDGRRLALGSAAGWIGIRNLEPPAAWRLKGHSGEVGALAWSPDGKTLASASFDRSLALWDVEKRTVLHSLRGHVDNVVSVAWSPDGRTFASGSLDRSICLWRGAKLARTLSGHAGPVNALAWSPGGRLLASGSGDQTVRIWDPETGEARQVLKGPEWVGSLAWSPDGRTIASGTGRGRIDLWDAETGRSIAVEGHTDRILAVAFNADGRLLGSKSHDGTVRLWRALDGVELACIPEPGEYLSGIAFQPGRPVLATRDDRDNAVRLWELDEEALLARAPSSSVSWVNAKVVLVGDRGVGKSGLGGRLSDGVFRPTASTHGAQFWQIQVERPASLPEHVRAEITLWDLAGQPEYRLVHQLFLDGTDAALLLFDGSDAAEPFRGVEFWARALRKRMLPDAPKLLVAARCDVSPVTADPRRIRDLLKDCGLQKLLRTSAHTGQGVKELMAWIRESIAWADLERVTAPRFFQVIRAFLLESKKAGRALLDMHEIVEEVSRRYREREATPAEVGRVVDLLQAQGLVQRLGGRVLLRPELLNQYASSVIQAARNHPEGLGVVAEREVLIADLDFSGVERLPPLEERIVLEAMVELLIRNDLCFRELGWLVFPSQVSASRPDPPADQPRAEVAYRFQGSVETVFASLVVRLSLTNYFRREEIWSCAAEFSRGQERLGFAVRPSEEGRGEIEIYFTPGVSELDRVTFVRFIADHLSTKGFEIQELVRRLRCLACGQEVRDTRAIDTRVRTGSLSLPCQYCSAEILIPRSIEERYRLDPAYQETQSQIAAAAEQGKESAVVDFRDDRQGIQPKADRALRILHLSDLHLRSAEEARLYRAQLQTDLKFELKIEQLDYLVISGDVTDRASPEELDSGFELVDGLVRRFGLNSDRIVVVPGNHDLSWDLSTAAYRYVAGHQRPRELGERFIDLGPTGVLQRDEELYRQRFAPFSHFYKKVQGLEYPLEYSQQALLIPRPEDRLLFLALNSAWQIDHHFKGRASIHPGALATALEKLLDGSYDGWLKIAVWHHPVRRSDAMSSDFLEQLAVHGFQIALHGHIHEAIDDCFRYDWDRRLHIVGAGTFGAPSWQQVAGVPLQYNLLRIDRERGVAVVETRRKEKPEGAWMADARWGSKSAPKPYYEIPLR